MKWIQNILLQNSRNSRQTYFPHLMNLSFLLLEVYRIIEFYHEIWTPCSTKMLGFTTMVYLVFSYSYHSKFHFLYIYIHINNLLCYVSWFCINKKFVNFINPRQTLRCYSFVVPNLISYPLHWFKWILSFYIHITFV